VKTISRVAGGVSVLVAFAVLWSCANGPAQTPTITIQASQPVKSISPDLFGIFFEDLNYAADGGL
jgi:hypothetical protein